MRRIGVDIGGTFTDVIAMDEDGQIEHAKSLTTYPDPTVGFFTGLSKLGDEPATFLGHGTTLATNALLTGRGAPTALMTTKGFRDVLEIRRTHRKGLFDLYEEIPPPIVPRDARLEVAERIGADGSVVLPLDESEVRDAARRIRELGATAVAVSFLFSFTNDAHERRARAILALELPDIADDIAISSEILPLHREYERTSTTVVSASLMPLLRTYFADLESEVRRTGTADVLLIMQNTGGLVTPRRASEAPVLMLLSGPAGGATATAYLGRQWEERRLLALDMGGTSTDVSAVIEGNPDTRLDFEIGGYDISYPSIDIHTIGAGGGSQARVDGHGRLLVGPESAGSTPGPACYGRGGELPTVTDANLVLGYYDPGRPLGGEIEVDPALAERAIDLHVAKPLGMDVRSAARGIIALVNASMVHALRYISIERGRDPREFVLVPFGGAGPIHGAALAAELGIRRLLIPPVPGCTSAMGIIAADFRHELVRAAHVRLRDLAELDLDAWLDRLGDEAAARLQDEGVARRDIRIDASADVRYIGQAYELNVALPRRRAGRVLRLARAFHAEHRRRYGHALADDKVEVVNLRVTGIGLTPKPALSGFSGGAGGDAGAARVAEREVWLGTERLRVPVYDRQLLPSGAVIPAPAIVSQLDATTLIPPSATARVDAIGSIAIELGG
jgi:N-methylhydantoinase A